MLKINRLKKIKSNFPVLVGDKVVEKNTCNLLIDEISKSKAFDDMIMGCLLYTSPSPRDVEESRMPSSA